MKTSEEVKVKEERVGVDIKGDEETSTSSSSPSAATATINLISSTLPMDQIISKVQDRFSMEVKNLNEELGLARQRISEQKEEISSLNVKLVEELIGNQKLQLKIAVEKEAEAEEKLKNSLEKLNEEYSQFFEDVNKHLMAIGQQSNLSVKERLDQLNKFVEEMLEKNVKEDMALKTTINHGINQVFQNLIEFFHSQNLEPLAAPGTHENDITAQETQPEPKIISGQVGQSNTSEVLPETVVEGRAVVDVDHAEDTTKGHLKKFFCICGVKYTAKTCLVTHIRTLTEEGNFKCRICQEKFVQFCLLRRHLESKHKIKRKKGKGVHYIGCMDCGKTFSSRLLLWEHRSSVHLQASLRNQDSSTTEQPVKSKCTIKDPLVTQTPMSSAIDGTPTPELLKVSREIVSGEKHGMNVAKRDQGFYCICGIRFVTRTGLDDHIQSQPKRHVVPFSIDSPPVSKLERITTGGIGKGPRRIARLRAGSRRRQNRNCRRRTDHSSKTTPNHMEPSAPALTALPNGKKEENVEGTLPHQDTLGVVHKLDTTKVGRFLHCTCGNEFVTMKGLRFHVKRKTEKWRFQCGICKKLFFYNSSKEAHLLSRHKIHGDSQASTASKVKNQTHKCIKCSQYSNGLAPAR